MKSKSKKPQKRSINQDKNKKNAKKNTKVIKAPTAPKKRVIS